MMLARPPGRDGDPSRDCGCERHPRLRLVLWLLWLVLALGLALFAGHGLAQASAPVTVDLAPHQLTPRVWYVQGDSGPVSLQNQGFNSNAGFVVTDEGVVVFDALGTPALEQLRARNPRVVVGGHGAASRDASRDLALTRDYLRLLLQEMRHAADELVDFDEAYARTDWSRFATLPAFEATNRRNAYNVYLRMQREVLGGR